MSEHAIVNPADHGNLRVHTEAGARFGDATMACLAVPAEFRMAQAHYPIVLRRDLASGKLAALALFGFEEGENLFLVGDRWDAAYRPLAQVVQPFLIGRTADADGPGQVHIDLAHPRISTGGEGVRLFDESGRPTPYLEDIAGKLGDLDHYWRESAGFFAAIERHGLVEPFTLEVTLDDGAQHTLVGYQTINEERLAALDGEALADLHRDGHLGPLYMLVASLAQFPALLARRNARSARG